jgi:hypothetical protein
MIQLLLFDIDIYLRPQSKDDTDRGEVKVETRNQGGAYEQLMLSIWEETCAEISPVLFS